MAGDRRFSIPLSVVIKCVDNYYYGDCALKMSVRNHSIGLRIEGCDIWPHMTPRQARRLAKWLARGADEADERQIREGRYWEKRYGR